MLRERERERERESHFVCVIPNLLKSVMSKEVRPSDSACLTYHIALDEPSRTEQDDVDDVKGKA